MSEEAVESTLKKVLLETASASLRHGVEHGSAAPIEVDGYDKTLQRLQASFVTLRKDESLRGCMGSSRAQRPLIEDVSLNAYAAGFLDPRFGPVEAGELDQLDIHISVLSDVEELVFDSEEDLLSQVRPGVDGLLLQEADRRSTLLPAVWQMIEEPTTFLRELKLKAGLEPDYWSDDVRMFRYTAESIP